MRARWFGCLVVALVAVEVGGCGGAAVVSPDEVTWRSSADEREAALRVLATQLVPEGVEATELDFGDCSEAIGDPNCVSVSLLWEGLTFDRRKNTMKALALDHGWEGPGEYSLPGGDFVGFRRDGYTVRMAFAHREKYPGCVPGASDYFDFPCRDKISIEMAR